MRHIVCAALLTFGCAHSAPLPLTLGPVKAPALDDDLPLEPLLSAMEAQAELLEHSARTGDLRVGDRVIARAAYAEALRQAAALGRKARDTRRFLDELERRFRFYAIS